MKPPVGAPVMGLLMAAVVACSPATVDGTASALPGGSSTAVQSQGAHSNYDPCTDISDASVASFGLDPSTKTPSVAQGFAGGAGCGWKNPQVSLDFFVTSQSIDDVAGAGFSNTKKLTLDGRSAVQVQIDIERSCAIAVSSQGSLVVVSLTLNFSSIGSVDPCATALAIATKLAPTLPK